MKRAKTVAVVILATLIMGAVTLRADGPADNQPDQVRPIPPIGQELPAATQEALRWRCKVVRSMWQSLEQNDPSNGSLQRLASEVLVFPRAVELAIEFNQFYKPNDAMVASELLDEATRRIGVIQAGGDWSAVVGLGDGAEQQLLVGGYRSKIDGSYQPYALVIPPGLGEADSRLRRLDIWFHGRGETLSEVAFLGKQRQNAGQYTPRDTIVLHPYGRYCNAFKFAGEVDVLEALRYVRDQLPIDPDRISVRGFSMGGAACWQFATHYADHWFAANPGAGFSETPEFLRVFQNEPVRSTAPEYQQTLWQWYDCPPWAINLSHCPTVAYSGEIDRQKQAADVMEEALSKVGIDMVHVIGPDTAHKIHPESKLEVESRMNSIARSASRHVPQHVEFATVTLRYHKMHWVDVRGLNQHWKPARVSASILGATIAVESENVTRLKLVFEPGQWPGPPNGNVTVQIDDTEIQGANIASDRSWQFELVREADRWQPAGDEQKLVKRPGLQGPIDDAFMDRFLFVLPSGKSSDPSVDQWVEEESLHAMFHWKKHFRGDVRKKFDTQLTDADIASSNLVLFGDAESNSVIRLIQKDLPVEWNEDSIVIGNAKVSREGHVPILIYPNPLNASRYVVINSGFTYREYDYLNNARQTPKLPDWALVDVRSGATTQMPGEVIEAGFFDESWKP